MRKAATRDEYTHDQRAPRVTPPKVATLQQRSPSSYVPKVERLKRHAAEMRVREPYHSNGIMQREAHRRIWESRRLASEGSEK